MAVGFAGEKYDCPACTGPIGEPDNIKGWRCQSCSEHLWIYAEYPQGVRHVLERVQAKCVEKYDLLVLEGSPLDEVNEVLSVDEQAGSYRIALKGFGVLKKVEPGKEFNRVKGSW